MRGLDRPTFDDIHRNKPIGEAMSTDLRTFRCDDCQRPMSRDKKPGHLRLHSQRKCYGCYDAHRHGRQLTERPLLPEDGIVDEIAVDRVIGGDLNILVTRSELLAAVTGLVERGRTSVEIADHVKVSVRTVDRMRVESQVAA